MDFLTFRDAVQLTGTGGFTVLHVNIRSMRKHWDEFCCVVSVTNDAIDAFTLTDINTAQNIMPQFSLDGYQKYFFTREESLGGGIAVFTKYSWISSPLTFAFTCAESLAIRIQILSFDITLLALYRPPRQNVQTFVEELSAVSFYSGHICIIGDLNIDLLKNKKPIVVEYLNALADAGIEATIDLPTGIKFLGDKAVSSCLDHVNVRPDRNDVLFYC